ncbi:3'-5' exonuclease [Helicobacter sp. MIT 14-3879]|uniref:3'-5' exonuclease n=1 Tax=Helicobacter sp. MIT 14-3879 TaxID=2040649 RepID=UPI000E1FA2BB|nr:3'-5' exonuclease [Helicobacter sp. MIT 14-3879]RDU61640.1 3'-5' exonuclease [Helicobacter sp. MIT 14-3879]
MTLAKKQDSLDIYKNYDNLIDILLKKDFIGKNEFLEILDNNLDFEINFEMAISFGIPLIIKHSNIALNVKQDIFSQIFCIIDIETTGFSPNNDDIIEIGAIKYINGNIIDRFESYINAKNIPPKITEITGITTNETINAPNIKNVLERFKLFLKDSIFMAHNINFDFNFINEKLILNSIPPMKNLKLCTLNLARKTIASEKYGLEHLNKVLDINYPTRHRAYADCIIALKVFENSILNLPNEVKNVKDLLYFANMTKYTK